MGSSRVVAGNSRFLSSGDGYLGEPPGSDLKRPAASDCAHPETEPASRQGPSVAEYWVGLEFDHLFGYRVLDAGAIVKMAKDSKMVPERFHCVGGSMQDPEKIPTTGKLVLTFTTDACEGKENFVPYLEHVQVVVTVNVTRRGDLDINMTSPMGTKSILLSHCT
ncbi:unnamed protein product [Rangifer tarandus platyrhynchus]|uniref:Uncharacterized protein n=1 Tax=Rangifer tarandus platyrhynchus TaxID=3082113 RepID=A0AC59ZFJ4_RANTA